MSALSEPKDRPCPPGHHIEQSDGDCYTCGWHVTAHASDPAVEQESVSTGACPFGRPDATSWEGPYLELPW